MGIELYGFTDGQFVLGALEERSLAWGSILLQEVLDNALWFYAFVDMEGYVGNLETCALGLACPT